MSDRPELMKVLSCTSLPSLPTVGVQVLSLTRDPDVSMDQIAKVIETDPALSAKVLKTVNSSVYGLKSPCTTIRRALNYLGLSAVKSIVLGFSLVESTRGVDGDDAFDINDHWRRSIFGAAAARVIAQKVGKCDPEEAFAAALFQDLGALAMFTALGQQYTKAISPAPKEHTKHLGLEKAAMGFTHAECGAALATKWRLPDRYVQTIQHHHAPDGADPDCRDLVRAVGLGTMTAAALASESPGDHLPALLASARQWFNLSPGEMAQLLGQIGKASAELAKLFGKQVGVVPDPAALMQQANEELVNQQIAAMRDAEAMRERNEALVKQTITDALTGIGNRKKFNDEAERLFADSSTIGRSFALVMCDGDKFKSVNDTHGHHVGDAVLKELAGRIAAAVGTAGIACRYGGEEFALLVPGVSLPEAMAIAEQARKAVGNAEFDLAGVSGAPPTLPVTISLGVACNEPTGVGSFATIGALIESADKALYTAKQTGRNRVCTGQSLAPAASASATPAIPSPTTDAVPVPTASAPAPAARPQGMSHVPAKAAPATPPPARATTLPVKPMVASASAVAPSSPKRVLLVEDDSLAARMILAVIAKCPGVEGEWVKSVQEATKRIGEGVTDPARAVCAVVTDLTVIGGTGLEVVAVVRGQQATAHTPIIVVSVSDDPEIAHKCLAAGADAFLSKDNLVQQLAAWVIGATTGQTRAKAA